MSEPLLNRSLVIKTLRSAASDASRRPDISATKALNDIADQFEKMTFEYDEKAMFPFATSRHTTTD
jgi:hypothetical protein